MLAANTNKNPCQDFDSPSVFRLKCSDVTATTWMKLIFGSIPVIATRTVSHIDVILLHLTDHTWLASNIFGCTTENRLSDTRIDAIKRMEHEFTGAPTICVPRIYADATRANGKRKTCGEKLSNELHELSAGASRRCTHVMFTKCSMRRMSCDMLQRPLLLLYVMDKYSLNRHEPWLI